MNDKLVELVRYEIEGLKLKTFHGDNLAVGIASLIEDNYDEDIPEDVETGWKEGVVSEATDFTRTIAKAAIEAYEQHLKDEGKVIVDVSKVKVMHKAAEQHARKLYVDASNQTGKKQERTSKHVKDIMSVLYQVEKMIEASEKG